MGSIDNLTELNYIFNGTKLSLADAKAGLKTFFNKGNNKQEIFNSMSNDLKQNLFNSADENIQKALLNNMINDLDSDLYKFIKTKN